MKKFLILILCLIFSIPCAAFADLSSNNGQEIYVRKDIYQNDMRNINEKLDNVIKNVNTLDVRDEISSDRVVDIRNILYIILFIVIVMPLVIGWHTERPKQNTPSFTLDDVKRLIEENNAMLLNKIQGGAA